MITYVKTYWKWLVLICATLLVSIVVTMVVYDRSLKQKTVAIPDGEIQVPVLDLGEPDKDMNALGILLLGFGGAGHDGGMLTDVIQLVFIDFEKSQINLISIPRDLWVQLPDGRSGKINKVFTMGDSGDKINSGGQIAKQMAQAVTGLPIDYFISVDFVGFQRLIGQDLGGIEVEVGETLDDPWYPIRGEEVNICDKTPEEVAELSATLSGFELEKQFECRYQHIYYQPGIHEMQGGDALAYVRSRHGSGAGDFSRSRRQHEVLTAIRDKLLSMDAIGNYDDIFHTISKNVYSDIDLEIIKKLLPNIEMATDYQVNSIVISTDNVLKNGRSSGGEFILLPISNWQAIKDFVAEEMR